LGAIGTMTILSVLDRFEAARWIVVLLRPSTALEEHEKKEASLKSKDLWTKISAARIQFNA
jgi:hypothetical protein